MKKTSALLSSLFFSLVLTAQVKLPAIIRDSMILQRDVPAKIWGWASPHEKIKIVFKKKTHAVKADAKGNWSINLPPTAAGGPYTIDILSKHKISLREILFGEVWFCSGQSNMVHQLDIHDVTYAKEIAAANNPTIRQFWIPSITNLNQPQEDIPSGNWQPAVGEKVRPFSAVAYFFALKIQEKYKVPVGIINSSVGGTPVEAWTSEQGLKDFPAQLATISANKDTAAIRIKTAPVAPLPPVEDLGLSSQPAWYDTRYQPKGWRPINVPGYWEDQGIRDLNGVVWYRKTIQVSDEMAKQPSRMHMGRIVDADEVYINGKKVGATTYLYPQRRYHIPAHTFKKGENVIVIRVTNNNGKGGFVPDKPYELVAGNDTIDLKGTWHYKVGSVFVPKPAGGSEFRPNQQPASLFNGMVAPFVNYTIKGICWYQGESNSGRPAEYRQLLPALISDWRAQWKKPALPFIFAQLPGYMDYNYLPSESGWAGLRESQAAALDVPNTAMAVTIDLGEWNDVHPENKKDVGERLALAALKLAYHENLVSSGPVFESAMVNGDRIEISFKHTGSGLTTNDGEAPAEFAIAGNDKKFVWAKARIEGDKIIVWSPSVSNPQYVRYAWADNPVNPNVINREGLYASPFRTDK